MNTTGLKRKSSEDPGTIPPRFIYFLNINTGQVELPVAAIKTHAPSLY
jgi:hypothetical protein